MKKAINNIFNVCFFIVSIMIFEVAFSQMILQSFFAGLMIIPVAALFLYICIKKTDLIEKINYKAAWWILRIISIAFMMKLAFSLEVNFTWDWGGLINSSYNYIKTAKVDKLYYYARYPNNQFWLLCMVSLFKLIKLFVGNADICCNYSNCHWIYLPCRRGYFFSKEGFFCRYYHFVLCSALPLLRFFIYRHSLCFNCIYNAVFIF